MRRVAPTLVAVLALVACGSDGEGADDDGSGTAVVLCEALRGLDNEMVDAVNASVAGINDLDASERMPSVLAGIDDVEALLTGFADGIDDLELPSSPHVDELRAGLHDGVEAALDEVAAQREAFAGGPPDVPDDEVYGVVGTWFNAVEKAMSVLEPEISRLDDAGFEQAILDEPTCRNVIQHYVVD